LPNRKSPPFLIIPQTTEKATGKLIPMNPVQGRIFKKRQRENNIQAIRGINIISNLLKEPEPFLAEGSGVLLGARPQYQNDLNRLYSLIALMRSSLLGTIISRSMTN